MTQRSTLPRTHLTLAVDDLPASLAFFRDILALPAHWRGGFLEAQVTLAPDLTLHLQTSPQASPQASPQGTPPTIQITVADLQGALTELRRRGAEVLVWPVRTDWGTNSAFIAGPGGLVVEIAQESAPDPAS